jgi:hypothetical protein
MKRTSWKPLAGLVLSVLLAGAGLAQPAFNPTITAGEIREAVRYLASDELAGRGSGTPGGRMAAAYVAERFREAGLRPGGPGGSYRQDFPVIVGATLGTVNTLNVTAPGVAPARLKVKEAFLPVAFSGNGRVSGPVVFAGYGISQPELKWDEYQGLDVRGKIVLLLRKAPEGGEPGRFDAYASLRYKAAVARDRGAAGLLFVTGPLAEGEEDLGRLELDGAFADSGIPMAIVRRRFVEPLFRAAGQELRGVQTAIAHGTPQSFALPGSRVELQVEVRRQQETTANVLGVLEGSDPTLRAEYVVIGAHYDHLGLGGRDSLSASHEPQVHHGADDNASGTAGIIELAQYFSANRQSLRRSLLFIGFSGEEMGLLGSAYFVKNPTVPLDRIVAMLNLDMVGRATDDTVQVIGTGTSSDWKAVLDAARAAVPLKTKENSSGFDASDQVSFYARDIPVLFFFTGVHPDYHKPSDTWEKINAEGEAKLLQFVAAAAERIAALPQRPRFTRADPTSRPAARFSVYLGTIPDYSDSSSGVALTGVSEGSPAEKAGLKAGDVIVEFGGRKITNVYDYTFALRDAKAGVPLDLVVLRMGNRVKVRVTPAARN